MSRLTELRTDDLTAFYGTLCKQYDALKTRGLALNVVRGKPSPEQLDLSNDLLDLPDRRDWRAADGSDARNYYSSLQGLPEARALFSPMLGAPVERMVVGNNSSLALMHDCVVFALLKGVPDGDNVWDRERPIKFLCPTPGYDRHFAICEEYGIGMIPVPMTGEGPELLEVERVATDPSVKAMWCVPKYSNPTGESYSTLCVERLASMRTGARDFRLFWDNAYATHHLTEEKTEIPNVLELCERAGNPNRAFVFASTSKMTFAGSGLALFASSTANVRWLTEHYSKRSIGPDKLNQLRHVRLLKDLNGINNLMDGHRRILAPKFAAVDATFSQRLSGTGVATWTRPKGGYFVSLDVLDGCARRVVALAKDAGIVVVPAGAAFPYGHDPHDRHLRIAPSFPTQKEVEAAANGIALCVLRAAAEKIMQTRT